MTRCDSAGKDADGSNESAHESGGADVNIIKWNIQAYLSLVSASDNTPTNRDHQLECDWLVNPTFRSKGKQIYNKTTSKQSLYEQYLK